MSNETSEIASEIDVLKREFDFILKEEIPATFDELITQISIILQYLTKIFDSKKTPLAAIINQSKMERLNLTAPQVGLEGIKCSLTMNAFELNNIEINYKPTQRHNNYIYKSREDSVWHLHQISNCGDTLKSLVSYINNLNLPFTSHDQAMFHIEHLLDEINAARNILLFPKKRLIPELQAQKNMKIFPLVPNDLVFSFYIQGYKLVLAIYVIKGSETSRYTLECTSITWLNKVMILLTSCLQKLQQVKDKMNIFDQLVFIEDQNQSQIEIEKKVFFNQETESEICTFDL